MHRSIPKLVLSLKCDYLSKIALNRMLPFAGNDRNLRPVNQNHDVIIAVSII